MQDFEFIEGFIDPSFKLKGSDHKPLSGLHFAVKDIIDIKGRTTGCGHPTWAATHTPAPEHANVVSKLLEAGASIKGITHTDALAFSLNGENAHYGTPINPRAKGRIPGGSSSGSASVTAQGKVDFALGSDTGGSVRAPSSYCGLFGLRPSHGRVSLSGVMPLAPSYDTIGWFARDPEIMTRVGEQVLNDHMTVETPSFKKILLPKDLWAICNQEVQGNLRPMIDKLFKDYAIEEIEIATDDLGSVADFFLPFRITQGYEIAKSHRAWIEQYNPTFGPGVHERFQWVLSLSAEEFGRADLKRQQVKDRLRRLHQDNPEHLFIFPTSPGVAPIAGQSTEAIEAFRIRALQLTSIAGLTGLPQYSLPVGLIDNMPVGLSLMACHGCDEAMLKWAHINDIRLQ